MERAYSNIKNGIVEGRYPPGAPLSAAGLGDIGGYRYAIINQVLDVQGVVWQKAGDSSYTPKTIIATETAIPTAMNDAGIGAGVGRFVLAFATDATPTNSSAPLSPPPPGWGSPPDRPSLKPP